MAKKNAKNDYDVVSSRIPPEVKDMIEMLAQEQGINKSKFIENVLTQATKNPKSSFIIEVHQAYKTAYELLVDEIKELSKKHGVSKYKFERNFNIEND